MSTEYLDTLIIVHESKYMADKKTTPHGTGEVNSQTIIWADYRAKRGVVWAPHCKECRRLHLR